MEPFTHIYELKLFKCPVCLWLEQLSGPSQILLGLLTFIESNPEQ